MHKGRFCPRVHPFVLSEDALPPHFAPKLLAFTGTVIGSGFGDVITVPAPFQEAAIDEDLQTITWEGDIPLASAGIVMHWKLVQDRGGATWPLRVSQLLEVPGGTAMTRKEWEPLVNGWGLVTVSPAGAFSTYTGIFTEATNVQYFAEQWR